MSGGGRRPADARGGGGGGGEAGRREPTTKLASVAERTARLEWKEPTPAERSRDSGERGRPAGRSRYRAQAAGWAEGRDLAGQRTRTSRPGAVAPAAGQAGPRISPPQSEPYTEGAAGEICLRGRDPPRSRPGRGLFPSPAGGWSQPRPLPLRTSGKNLRADGRGEWKDAGRRQERRGQVEPGRVEESCTWSLVAEYARVFPRQIIPGSPLFDPFTDRETEACSGAEICSQDARTGEAEPARPCPNPLWAWLLSPAPRSR